MTISRKLLIAGLLISGIQPIVHAYSSAPYEVIIGQKLNVVNFVEELQRQQDNAQAQEIAPWLNAQLQYITDYDLFMLTRTINNADSTTEEKIAHFMNIKKAEDANRAACKAATKAEDDNRVAIYEKQRQMQLIKAMASYVAMIIVVPAVVLCSAKIGEHIGDHVGTLLIPKLFGA